MMRFGHRLKRVLGCFKVYRAVVRGGLSRFEGSGFSGGIELKALRLES